MASRQDLTIEQGTSVGYTLNIADDLGNPIDVVEGGTFTAKAQIRKSYLTSGFVEFAISNDVLGGTIMTLDADQTSTIPYGKYVWDMKITDTLANTVYRVVEGVVNITPQVTR